MKLSIIAAFLNEAQNLPNLRERLLPAVGEVGCELEIVLLDDHSSDASQEIAKRWAHDDSRVTYVRLSRNCGSHVAISAGLARCVGDCAIVMAAELRDPPELIPQLVAKWRGGYDVLRAAGAVVPLVKRS